MTTKLTSRAFIVTALVLVLAVASTFVAPRTASATTCRQQVFRQSSTYKDCVVYMQRMLNAVRSPSVVMPTLATDGYFGPRTRNNVITFQSTERIGVDGVVGPETWGRLCHPAYFYIPDYTYADYINAAWRAGC